MTLMYQSPYAPEFAVIVELETVAAHHYDMAGFSPLYLTPEDGVHTNVANAATFSTKRKAADVGQRAKKNLWGIASTQVTQVNPNADEGAPNVRVKPQ